MDTLFISTPYSVSVGIPAVKSSFLLSSTNGICHLTATLFTCKRHFVYKKMIKASTLAGVAFMICGIDSFLLSGVTGGGGGGVGGRVPPDF